MRCLFVTLFILLQLGLTPPCLCEAVSLYPLQRQHFVQWETMSSSRMSEWYLPWELCLLARNESITHFKTENIKNCLSQQKGRARFSCRIGHIYHNMPCVFGTETTLSSMSHFYKNIRGHGDPSQRYMQSALNSLGAARAGVLMMGDSTLMAFFSAMMCELHRENIDGITQISDEAIGIKGTVHHVIRGAGPAVEMLFKQINAFKDHFLRQMKTYIEYILQTSRLDGVVVVVQAGTWYMLRGPFEQHMRGLFETFLSMAQRCHAQRKHITFVWAEQVAQHWPTPNGYFLTGKGHNLTSMCPPLRANATAEEDWRNDIVWTSYLSEKSAWRRELALLEPYARMRVLNFRALTSQMSDFHMRQGHKDCTHYCYTPMMYQGIYHQFSELSADLAADVAITKRLNATYSS